MASTSIVASPVASEASEGTNTLENGCSHTDIQATDAPCRALTDPVTRCADLMALIRARQTVQHIADLVRLRDVEIRTRQAQERRAYDATVRASHIARRIESVACESGDKDVTCPECGGTAKQDEDGTITCSACGYVAVAFRVGGAA